MNVHGSINLYTVKHEKFVLLVEHSFVASTYPSTSQGWYQKSDVTTENDQPIDEGLIGPVDKLLLCSYVVGLYARFLIVVIPQGHGGASNVELSWLTRLRDGAIGLHNPSAETGDEYTSASGRTDPLR